MLLQYPEVKLFSSGNTASFFSEKSDFCHCEEQNSDRSVVENVRLPPKSKKSEWKCAKMAHSRLDQLRTLILGNNILSDVNYFCSPDQKAKAKDGQRSVCSLIMANYAFNDLIFADPERTFCSPT